MEKTIEKSEEQAEVVRQINIWLPFIDVEYLREAAKETHEAGNWMDAAAVLSRNYTPEKANLKRLQAKAMDALAHYIESSLEIGRMKVQIAEGDTFKARLDKMFE